MGTLHGDLIAVAMLLRNVKPVRRKPPHKYKWYNLFAQ